MQKAIYSSSRGIGLEEGKMVYPPIRVHNGNPVPSAKDFILPDDKSFSSGLWECTPGQFTVEFTWDETIYILQGRMTVEDESHKRYELGPGDFFYFPKGSKTKWTIHEKLKKVYFTKPWYISTIKSK